MCRGNVVNTSSKPADYILFSALRFPGGSYRLSNNTSNLHLSVALDHSYFHSDANFSRGNVVQGRHE